MHASQHRVTTANLGFPRMGPGRELKQALESYWAGQCSVDELNAVGAGLRRAGWIRQRDAGIDHIPVNDFSLYDHVLDTAVMVGAVPERYRGAGTGLDSYFAMARGGRLGGREVGALEMTKWFDTNYHYIVPELVEGQPFEPDTTKIVAELAEAKALGIEGRPVLVGPLTLLLVAKGRGRSTLSSLPGLLGAYESVLARLEAEGATWVQVDEPVLGLDLDTEVLDAYRSTYAALAAAAPSLRLILTTYFAGLGPNFPTALGLPVAGLHLDLVAAPDQLEPALQGASPSLTLSLGLVDGRNVWRSDLDAAVARVETAIAALGPDRVIVAPSSSLLHLPFDLAAETKLDPAVREWLAFAVQRLEEVSVVAWAAGPDGAEVEDALLAARAARQRRRSSPLVRDPAVQARLAEVDASFETRPALFPERRALQQERIPLPVLPTTTIGSFPQTAEVRSLRARYRQGDLPAWEYEAAMQVRIADAVRLQAGINDMVEYFGEHLAGFTLTEFGWVQSYGSRGVKPPIIHGDVSRPEPITVPWTSYAQSLTERPVKGMLTGPVTMLQWSFVRDDQPRSETCRQIALAVRDEVADLEAAGTAIVQIDEPALREGLPLRTADRAAYLAWAVAAFRIASSGVADATQIHTHMCYGEFEDVIDSIVAFDADVLSIEAARSGMDLLQSFAKTDYPNDIGPGIWDIHSPRVPSVDEFVLLLERAAGVFPVEGMWVNPDCGLKTRAWAEVEPALRHLVDAARRARSTLSP
jgi:5-methyltetrahydropteroyltriglutamate--homocysteine methyltransferase